MPVKRQILEFFQISPCGLLWGSSGQEFRFDDLPKSWRSRYTCERGPVLLDRANSLNVKLPHFFKKFQVFPTIDPTEKLPSKASPFSGPNCSFRFEVFYSGGKGQKQGRSCQVLGKRSVVCRIHQVHLQRVKSILDQQLQIPD